MPVQLQQRIDEILADTELTDDASGPTKAEAIDALIPNFGWPAICDCMLGILRDDHHETHWRTAADVFWGAALDRREMPADEVIAWLYFRFDPDGQSEDNEVWSIASQLKGVGYLSDYNPLADPAVLSHMQAIKSRA